MSSLARTLQEQLAVDEISTGQYVSRLPPEKMANVTNIAYGGCTLGVAIAAACQTVKPGYHLYTAMGNYLGSALTDRKLFIHVQSVRDTRTFATRQVPVSQKRDGHQERRPCLTALIDFQLAEKKSLLRYSASPAMVYAAAESLHNVEQVDEHLVTSGKVLPELIKLLVTEASLMHRVFDIRPSPEGVMHQSTRPSQNTYDSRPSHTHRKNDRGLFQDQAYAC
jgi:acyl-CoA thioesterase II